MLKFRAPLYLALTLLACGYLVAANLKGFTPFQGFGSGSGGRFFSTNHK